MNIFTLCGFILLSAILCTVLKGVNQSAGFGVAWAAIVAAAFFTLTYVLPITDFIKSTVEISGIKTVLKSLGISFFCSLSCDLCTQLGENSLAKALELAGKTVICVLCVPLVKELIFLLGEITS